MKNLLYTLSAFLLLATGFAQQPVSVLSNLNYGILFMREEEKLARDVYDSLYIKWNSNPFGNIRHSEQTHMDLVKSLISNYDLSDPVVFTKDVPGVFVNTTLQNLYNELVSTGSLTFTQSLKVGAKIEELDIHDLLFKMGSSKQPDVQLVYTKLNMASENHLRAFVRRLHMEGVDYQPVILTKVVFDKIVSAGNNNQGGRGNNR